MMEQQKSSVNKDSILLFIQTNRKNIRIGGCIIAVGVAGWLIINNLVLLLQAGAMVLFVFGCLWLARGLWLKNKED